MRLRFWVLIITAFSISFLARAECLGTREQVAELFAQNSYERIRSLVPETHSPQEHIQQVLSMTNVDELDRIEKIAIQKQITRYDDAKQWIAKLRRSPISADHVKADHLEKVLNSDKIALGNGPHVREVINTFRQNSEAIKSFVRKIDPSLTQEQLDHYVKFLETTAAVHDIGKVFPSKEVLENAVGFLDGRIGMHEISSVDEIQFIAKHAHVSEDAALALERNILGHNDGSGLEHVWWNHEGHKVLGPYPLPDTLSSQLLALVDRGGQANLGVTGGVMKITYQRMATGEPWGKNLLENGSMLSSAENTIAQIKEIGKHIRHGMGRNPLYLNLIEKQQKSIDAFRAIHWDASGTSGTLWGKTFSSPEQFFAILNSR